MGGRKHRLSLRKNGQKKKARLSSMEPLSLMISISRHVVAASSLTVTFPIAAYIDGTVTSTDALCSRLSYASMPSQWTIATTSPLTLCKMRVIMVERASKADVMFTISIGDDLNWTVFVVSQQLYPDRCFTGIPPCLNSVRLVQQLMIFLDQAKLCTGNTDEQFLDLLHHRSLTLHGSTGSTCCIDEVSFPGVPSVRHTKCQLILSQSDTGGRCSVCSSHRSTLLVQTSRLKERVDTTPSHSSHVNHRYQSLPHLIGQLKEVHHQYRIVTKQRDRLKAKIAAASDVVGISLDQEVHDDLLKVTTENTNFFEAMPSDSFGRIFWQQQAEAASKTNARSMRWHPLMIRWCLYLRHRSSGAYETLRNSGCLSLPSQRTLRDYTHYIYQQLLDSQQK